MRNNIIISALTLLFGITSVYGQVNLSEMEPASTDSLQKSRIRHFSQGKGGRNRVWDFSEKLGSSESSQVLFIKDSTGVVSVMEPGRISYYRTTPDTLVLFGSESPLEKREYAINRIAKKFPLEYGDSISNDFRCEGMYCGNHPFREVGTTTVKVDADGLIVLAENDTVRDVRRVHTIDSYAICMEIYLKEWNADVWSPIVVIYLKVTKTIEGNRLRTWRNIGLNIVIHLSHKIQV